MLTLILKQFLENSHNVKEIKIVSVEIPLLRSRMEYLNPSIFIFVFICNFLCSALSQGIGGKCNFIDLAHDFANDTIRYYGNTPPKVVVRYKGYQPETRSWYQIEDISSSTHIGSHFDAPNHYSKNRWSVTDVPLARLFCEAVVIDISREVGDNPNVHLTPRMIKQWERRHGKIPDGSVLLIRTGWSRFYSDPKKYMGTPNGGSGRLSFPSLSEEGGRWLLENRNVYGVGIDTLSMDVSNGRMWNHIHFSDRNIYFIENLKDLDKLPAVGTSLTVMPMKVRDASGAPVRVVARVPCQNYY